MPCSVDGGLERNDIDTHGAVVISFDSSLRPRNSRGTDTWKVETCKPAVEQDAIFRTAETAETVETVETGEISEQSERGLK